MVWLRDGGTGNKIPAVGVDSGSGLPGAGICAAFHPYLVITVGEPRPTDPHLCIQEES